MKNTKWIVGGVVLIVGVICITKIAGHAPLPEGSWRGGTTRLRGGSVQLPNPTLTLPLAREGNPNLVKTPTKKLVLKNKEINLLVAQTPDESEWGLSDFPSLPPDTGMMFIFPEPGIYSFWMKDMRFALDMIWLDSDNRVVTIHKNISPDTYYKNPPELFLPTSPASAVIEVPAGFIQKNNLSVGDRLLVK